MDLKPGDPDPAPRDVHFVWGAEKRNIAASMCVVSNEGRGLAFLEGTVGAFKDDGSLITDGTRGYVNVPPLSNRDSKPKLIVMFNVGLSINPKYFGYLLDKTLVQIVWVPCKQAPAPTCEEDGPRRTSMFLLPVTTDHPAMRSKK